MADLFVFTDEELEETKVQLRAAADSPTLDKTLLEEIYTDAATFTKQYDELAGRNDRSVFWTCSNKLCSGYHPLVCNREGEITCSGCGHVKHDQLGPDQLAVATTRLRLHPLYNFQSHVGQKISQAVGCTPPIPHDLQACIDLEYETGDYPRNKELMHRDAVARILCAVRIPPWLQRKYQSKRYKEEMCKDLHRQKYFSERWLFLRYHWFGVKPQGMTPLLISRLRLHFGLFYSAFTVTRHDPATCNGFLTICHKEPGCHCVHNLPSYFFIFGHLFRVIQNTERVSPSKESLVEGHKPGHCPNLFELYMPNMPCIRLNTYRKFNDIVEEAFVALGWAHHFEPITFETRWTHEWVYGLKPK